MNQKCQGSRIITKKGDARMDEWVSDLLTFQIYFNHFDMTFIHV